MQVSSKLNLLSDKYHLLNLLASYSIRGKVLQAFEDIPREYFVSLRLTGYAYRDQPLPIGQKQTISQPSLVAIMLQTLDLKPSDKVLEIGTGSGFQTALLSKLAGDIYSLERLPTLARLAKIRLKGLSIKNAQIITADGTNGYSKEAPYDAIIVSAATDKIPKVYSEQIKEGGKLLIPLGDNTSQELILFEKKGVLEKIKSLGTVRFVPLVNSYTWVQRGHAT